MDVGEVASVVDVLQRGTVEACQHLPWGSNYTFLATLCLDGSQVQAIYKPRQGEQPLWDFPEGTLYLREHAAYVTSQALGWPFIPPTAVREGPYGIGSVQLFLNAGPLSSIRELQALEDLDLARIAAFDQLTNNADRKGGHVLRDQVGKLWGIDHGLCFGTLARVRTVLQHFCGQPVPVAVLDELRVLRADQTRLGRLETALQGVIAPDEFAAFVERLDALVSAGAYPRLDHYRSVPWPPF
jgi:uncharacterized repeat protein (TIGR03843 family)